MPQKDYVVVIKVLDRVKHKVIVRTVSDAAAANIAKFVAKDINELTAEEFKHIECEVTPFNELDMNECFVCF